MAGMAPNAQSANAPKLLPFLWGTQEQRVPIAAIPWTPGLKVPTIRIPKNGYLQKLVFRFNGSVTIGTAGTLGAQPLGFIISNYTLSYNGGFAYRQMDGESMWIMDTARHAGNFSPSPTTAQIGLTNDPVEGGRNWAYYNAATLGPQPIGFLFTDDISLNPQVNADRYLLAAQARNADITLDLTFGTVASFAWSGEVITATSGTLFIEALYLLDPDYSKFSQPDLSKIQQITTDTSYTNVTVGENVIPIVPVNGPKYLQIFFRCMFGGAFDKGGINSAVTKVQLRINNGLNRYDMSMQALSAENDIQLQRSPALPQGYHMLDFLNDSSINNTVSMVGRNVISTEKISNLWLIITVAAGTNLTNTSFYGQNQIKLIKRVEMGAVG